MRRVTWRTPAIGVLLIAVYYALYFTGLVLNGRFDGDFYAWGLVLAFAAPPVTALVLAVSGNRFWENDVGLNMLFLSVATMPENGGLAWTFLFNHGRLTATLLAWTVIGGPWWVVLCSLWRLWLILRLRDQESESG